jgi:hypothetical protein
MKAYCLLRGHNYGPQQKSRFGLLTQHLFDALGIGRGYYLIGGEPTGAAGGLMLQQVASISALTHYLAATGNPETLFGTRMGLVFRHLPVLLYICYCTWSRA